MSAPEPKHQADGQKEAFLADVQRRRRRHERYQREGDSSFWASVGMMGTVGWSVALPLALGALGGRWLDARYDTAPVYTLFFLIVGLVLGSIVAWRLISEKR